MLNQCTDDQPLPDVDVNRAAEQYGSHTGSCEEDTAELTNDKLIHSLTQRCTAPLSVSSALSFPCGQHSLHTVIPMLP